MSASDNSQALPLCLPDNCSWDDRTRVYRLDESKQRRALYSVSYTLSRLRAIPGPVCVVSIAGPCRQGKSYIISKVFDQGGVFPLGHLMDPETMGIWVWIVPKKYVDSEGREFTLVLLDSEGTDAVKSDQVNDHSIFTLTVLLSSILIYNSKGVPTRSDLDNLDHIGKLSQRIQIMSRKSKSRKSKVSPKKVLPLFIWLLRDVVLKLPPECNTFKEYLQQKVFTSNKQSTGGVAQDILQFFSGFDAFQLPPPSDDPEVLSNIHDATTQLNPAFLRGVQQFKKMLVKQLEPKQGFYDKELVTGEALALLVEEYVKTLNKPDAVPCIERAWSLFVDQKYSLAASEAQQLYYSDMEKQFKEKLPCDDNLIRSQHQETLYECSQLFDSHVAGIAEANHNEYRNTFLEFAEETENEWLRKNNKETETNCQNLLEALRLEILDPFLEQLSGSELSISCEDLYLAYRSVEEEFKTKCKGPKSLCENYATIFRMEAEDELQKHYQRLLLSKDYETRIRQEKDARAKEQEQIQQLHEETGVLRERREEFEKKMMELIKKRDEDLKRRAKLQSERMEAQKAEIETRNINIRAERERQRADMARRRQNLESSIRDLDAAIKGKDAEIANLRSRL